jgi:pimeloyl-ACP methyl ester carboxylesterase
MNRREFVIAAACAGAAASGPALAGSAAPKRARLVDGAYVEYQVYGQQGPFVFMGPQCYLTPDDGETMTQEYVAVLSERHRVIVADWPRGFGQSVAKPETMARIPAIRDLHSIADAAGAERFAWWGYSFGGAVGLQLARKNPRISALVCGGWPVLWQPVSDLLGVLQAMARRKRNEDPAELAGLNYQMILGSAAFYESISGQDDWSAAREIECPRLVLHDEDDILPVSEGYPQPLELAQRTRAAQQELKALGWQVSWVKTGRGHLAMLDTKAMLAAFGPFLDRTLLGRR